MSPSEDWKEVNADPQMEFPLEETSTLALIRDFDTMVLSVFPRGTSFRDVTDIAKRIPGVSVWVVQIQATYKLTGKGKKLGERKAKIREA